MSAAGPHNPDGLADKIAALTDILTRGRRIVPFTGAGISTESGIPDFRSPGGLWSRNKPIPYNAFLADEGVRLEAWRRRQAIDDSFAAAKPSRGHRAIAALYRAGKVPAVVTQNIDNLHQDSGVAAQDIVELHGNTTWARCLSCGERAEIPWAFAEMERTRRAPACPQCTGPLKTGTVSFGEPMPEEAMRRSIDLARQCDTFVVIGSSLVVWPAAGIPRFAKEHGATLVIVNREPTDLDAIADLVIHADIGTVFDQLARADAAD